MREESKLRSEDVRLSNNISSFLDRVLYERYTTDFERVMDKERQVHGIDTIFNHAGMVYTCDEKAAVRYSNLKTFSLELSFINRRGDVQLGWLLDDKEKNNSFLFIWIDDTTFSNTKELECALVRKDALKNHLLSMGWSETNLATKCARIRMNPQENLGNIYKDGCKFTYSTQLVEKPINILLPRETYKKIADNVWKFIY